MQLHEENHVQVLLASKLESNFIFFKRTALVLKIEKETEDLVLGGSWFHKDIMRLKQDDLNASVIQKGTLRRGSVDDLVVGCPYPDPELQNLTYLLMSRSYAPVIHLKKKKTKGQAVPCVMSGGANSIGTSVIDSPEQESA